MSEDISREIARIENREQFTKAAKNDPYDSLWSFECDPRDIFDFEVVDANEEMSWGESYIGTNLGCVTDYGDHWDLTDSELIEKVATGWKEGLTPQFLGFMDEDNENVAEKVVIVRKKNGYTKTSD